MKLVKTLSALLLATALAACGGGGGSPGSTTTSGTTTTTTTTTTVTPPAATPASIEVQASSNEVLSAGTEVTVTVVVKSATNVGMADQPLQFEVDNRATLKGAAPKTNADGVATVRLSAGAKDLRNITVTVRSGSASGQITLPVTGTRLTLTGASNVKAGFEDEYSARLIDSAGSPISGAAISATSALGNALTAIPLTDGNGQAKFRYTANIAGTDTLTVSGYGASGQLPIAVSGVDFIVVSPGAGTSVVVNTPQTVTVQYTITSIPQAGVTVQFSTTRGVLSAASAVTNAAGQASVQVSSSSAGPASVLAQIPDGQVSLPLQFIATSPASLVLQANPGAVLPNISGSANQSTLEATVQDASGNAVANRQVNFSITEDDGNGGTLSTPTALTDANGRAQVQFIPGPNSTGKEGVVLSAAVASTAISGTAALTVNGQALFVSIGFGNTIGNVDETSYIKAFSVYVTDATGTPVANQLVNLSTSPIDFAKGTLAWNGTVWTYSSGVVTCPNEDLNQNGSLDTSPVNEDRDGNGALSPLNPIVVSPGSVRTDDKGRATFSLTYGEQFAPWLSVKLTARASVGGTESSYSLNYFVNGLAADFSNETIPPAGVRSPFGTTLSCTSP